MKKRTKLIGTISAFAMSMAMLAGGVLAASQVNLNVSSTVSFEAQGVYLKVQGQVKRGTESGTSNLNESERPEGDVGSYSYLDYSYTEEADGTPSGSSSFKDMPEWTIGTVVFTESQNKIEYVMTFTNYSEKDIEVTITPTIEESLLNITASSTGASSIALTPNQTQSYTFTLTLNDFSKSTSGAVSFNISAVKTKIILAEVRNKPDYININLNDVPVSENIFVKENDVLKISSSDENYGIKITLYNSSGSQINSWVEYSRYKTLNLTVPELQEGYYFSFGWVPSRNWANFIKYYIFKI